MKTTSKRPLLAAIDRINEAEAELERVREFFQMEWGEGRSTDLDIALTVNVIWKLMDAKSGLDAILLKFRGKTIRPNFPSRKKTNDVLATADADGVATAEHNQNSGDGVV